jgi:tetraacyldisaccharide 4'-kinase
MLAVASWLYTLLVAARNACYDWRLAKVSRVAAPVVSVGNLTLGGTGKTPLVEWLVRWFQTRGVRVAIVSRGYKSQPGVPNDEALELAGKLPGTPHVQDPRRVVAAEVALREYGAALIVLDDAFQHRRIHRDLDIALLDALEPFGYEQVFPRGMLREPMSGLRRAGAVALSRSDAISVPMREAVRQRVRRLAPEAIWLEVASRPSGLCSAAGVRGDLVQLAGQRVAAFCGIGNPAGFRHTLAGCGCELVDFREFPDHHPYAAADVDSLCRWVDGLENIAAVLCTHKDLVKINVSQLGAAPLWALTIELEIMVGREEFERELARLVESRRGPTC